MRLRNCGKLRNLFAALMVSTHVLSGCVTPPADHDTFSEGATAMSASHDTTRTRGYAPVNGLKMYYEIEGAGDPLVFIPPAFGFAGQKSFPELARNHAVISVDLQGNGRTADIPDRPLSIEQYAADVAGLLKYLGISKADFLGESYGGDTAAMIAVRHPELVRRVVTYSATFAAPPATLDPAITR
jgi:pimeloyl-ACP methyl ester carboxylesterase